MGNFTLAGLGESVGQELGLSDNGMVRPCSCPASVLCWQRAPKTRSTRCLKHSNQRLP
jgi:hypothetical protein